MKMYVGGQRGGSVCRRLSVDDAGARRRWYLQLGFNCLNAAALLLLAVVVVVTSTAPRLATALTATR